MFRLLSKFKNIGSRRLWTSVGSSTSATLSFMLLLTVYMSTQALSRILRLRLIPVSVRDNWTKSSENFLNRCVSFVDRGRAGSISRVHLIELSLRNMSAKRTRTMITIGGMTIGIGAIVFLVSLGYGLQNLVVTRIARLEEIRQADVSPQTGSKVKINDKIINDIKNIDSVESVLPVISVVGRINYQNSITDIAVYGITSDYLKQSAIKPVEGAVFENNDLSISSIPSDDRVAGMSSERLSAEFGSFSRDVNYSIEPDEWVRVRQGPSTKSTILGYTKRNFGELRGKEVWGSSYAGSDDLPQAADSRGDLLMPWINSDFPLWKLGACDPSLPECEDGRYQKVTEEGEQVVKGGYIAQLNVQVSPASSVLGISADGILNPEVLATESGIIEDGDWVEIASVSAQSAVAPVKQVPLSDKSLREAVVSRAMVKVLGLKDAEAIGKTISTTFVIVGNLTGEDQAKIETIPAEYKIVGVIPEDRSPIMYVPFIDLRGAGIINFSQLKLAAKSPGNLDKIRKSVENLGFTTRSVADTVEQVNNLFATIRTILALLGMVALAVASLGMFNTLTVSLLERTREVGLMKAIGMKSDEVRELFLTESMIMGFFGGAIGVLIGFTMGKLLGVLLSAFAVFKGVGFIDISHVPPAFILIVIGLSLVVGLLTGIYPAHRATKISALNALRYE